MSGFALFAERRFFTAAADAVDRARGRLPVRVLGLLGIILQGGLIGRLVKKYGEVKLVLAGFIAIGDRLRADLGCPRRAD